MQSEITNATLPGELAGLCAAAAAALILDVESTKFAQRDPEAAELNSWIFGERPSRRRMYAVSVPVTVALAASASYLRASLSADAKNRWSWRLPLWGLIIGHSIAAAANFFNFRKATPSP